MKLYRPLPEDRHLRLSRNERKNLQGISHPHMVKLRDWGVIDNGVFHLPFNLLTVAPGQNLALLLAHPQPQPPPSPLSVQRIDLERVIRQLLAALAVCHRNGILHMHIKPSSIHVTADHQVTLLDFGISTAITNPELWSITIATMAPEILVRARPLGLVLSYFREVRQVPPKTPIGPWSDLFSVGRLIESLERAGARPSAKMTHLKSRLLALQAKDRIQSVTEALHWLG